MSTKKKLRKARSKIDRLKLQLSEEEYARKISEGQVQRLSTELALERAKYVELEENSLPILATSSISIDAQAN